MASGGAASAILPRSGEAVALRRRRLCDPVVALADPVEFARRALWPRQGLRRARRCSAPTSTSRSTPSTRPTPASVPTASRRMIEAAGAGMVMLVGVQSNQFPRALDLARPLRERGIQVGIGGFHVSGMICDARRRRRRRSTRAQALGISLFAGEAEGRLDEVLRDADAGTLKPLYNFMNDLPGIEGAPIPLLPAERVAAHRRRASPASMPAAAARSSARSAPSSTCRAASRAAARPTTSRRSCAPTCAQGLHRVLHHRRQFRPQQGLGADPRPADRAARGREAATSASSSRSTRSATSCRTSSRSARAPACKRVFIGLENINPDNLLGAKKRQNKITEYRKMLLAWKNARRHHLCRLHPRLPERHRRIDHARHRRDQARTAGRPAGVLLPDAAAGLGGSPEAASRRRADGSGHEQVRPQPRHAPTHPKMSREEWERAYRDGVADATTRSSTSRR